MELGSELCLSKCGVLCVPASLKRWLQEKMASKTENGKRKRKTENGNGQNILRAVQHISRGIKYFSRRYKIFFAVLNSFRGQIKSISRYNIFFVAKKMFVRGINIFFAAG